MSQKAGARRWAFVAKLMQGGPTAECEKLSSSVFIPVFYNGALTWNYFFELGIFSGSSSFEGGVCWGQQVRGRLRSTGSLVWGFWA